MNATSGPTIAERLADFALAVYRDPGLIPETMRAEARLRLLDNFGCAMIALRVPPAREIARLAASMGQGRCRVPGARVPTSPTAAALATGTMIQAFEMNDLGVYVHPGACIVPACLAAAEETGKPVPGAAFLAAMIAGYEITVRVSERILATRAAIYNHFNVQRHLTSRRTLRLFRAEAFAGWREVVSA